MIAAFLLATQVPRVVAPVVRERAVLRLTVDRAVVAENEDPGIRAVIRNTGREPLRLIQPQDGSEVGIRNPDIEWKLPELKEPPFYARCGNTNPIVESAFFTLAPGESREIGTDWAGIPQLQPGSNRVSFTYDIASGRKDGGHSGAVMVGGGSPELVKAEKRVADLYARLTPIKLTSNAVRITLQPRP